MKITFLGATRTVTGSNFLVEAAGKKFLVDCGMYQGKAVQEIENSEDFLYDPKEIDFMLLTHAHIDHSGLLPRLCAQGFTGPIYCTDATFELLKIMLPDSAHLQRSDVERAVRRQKAGKWRGDLPVALYSMEEAELALGQCEMLPYGKCLELYPGIDLEFQNAGHILGSAIAVIDVAEDHSKKKRCVFSGDIGMKGKLLMPDLSS